MPKPTKKEILEAMKDPDLLKEAGLQPIEDEVEKELFADIVLGENDTTEDLARKFNEKARKQRAYLQQREGKILKAAEKKAGEGEAARQTAEVDSFLKAHPELKANPELLDIVEPLYHNGKSLEDSWNIACASKGFDAKTGKAPLTEEEKKAAEEKDPEKKENKEEKKGKKTSLKTDTLDTGLPGQRSDDPKDGEDPRPKTIREIAGELSNDLAAKGTNPYRDS